MTAVVVTLVVIGTMAGVARSVYPSALAVRAESVRSHIWNALGLQNPPEAQRSRQVLALESRYVTNPVWIFVHASVGSVFLLAASLQLVRRFRRRHLQVHRTNGTLLVITGVVVAVTGLYFGVLIPAAGMPETIIIGLVGALFVTSLVNGALAIRRGDVRSHGEWMIRSFAVALGVATVRIVAAVADAMLTPRGWSLESAFVLSLALGWGITIVAAELWILRKRHQRVAERLALVPR